MFGPYNLPIGLKKRLFLTILQHKLEWSVTNITGAEMKTQGSGVFHHVTVYLCISWSLTCIRMGTVKFRPGFEILELMLAYTEMKAITRQPSMVMHTSNPNSWEAEDGIFSD